MAIININKERGLNGIIHKYRHLIDCRPAIYISIILSLWIIATCAMCVPIYLAKKVEAYSQLNADIPSQQVKEDSIGCIRDKKQ